MSGTLKTATPGEWFLVKPTSEEKARPMVLSPIKFKQKEDGGSSSLAKVKDSESATAVNSVFRQNLDIPFGGRDRNTA